MSAGGAIRTSTLLDPAGDLTVTAEEEVTVTGAGSTLEISTFNSILA